MGVFMEPLFDELVHAWDHGVWTYDRATKTNFGQYFAVSGFLHELVN